MRHFILSILALTIFGTAGCTSGSTTTSSSNSSNSNSQLAVKCSPNSICAPSQVSIVQAQ